MAMVFSRRCITGLSLLLLATLATSVNVTGGGPSGYNVFDNYCNRLYSQTSIKNEKIWIDGGLQSYAQWKLNDSLQSYTAIGPKFNATNPYLIQIPMDSSWNWKINITQIAINMSTPSESSGTSPPQVYQGAMFQGLSSDTRIWLYGGTYSWLAQHYSWFLWPNSQHSPLWSYDTASNIWQQYDFTNALAPLRPSRGYAAEAPDLGLAFYFNGRVNNGSSTEMTAIQDDIIFLEGMIVLDLSNVTAHNISTSSVTKGLGRVGGKAQYIPIYGDNGTVLFLGGGEKSVQDRGLDDFGNLISMSDILLFDVASLYSAETAATDRAWYVQLATGDIPEPRSDFCIVGAEAPDGSSYTIYLYGGHNQTDAFDDIYALTLPAFVWTQVYFDGASPRYGHDCHLATPRQMITLGGAREENIATCDWEVMGLSVYDISLNQWGSIYDASLSSYTIPDTVVTIIGGSPTGGATLTSPAGGWTDKNIAKMFGQPVSGTSKSSSKKLSGGAIAGIVIGILTAVAVGLTAIYLLLIKPKRSGVKDKQTAVEIGDAGTSIHEAEAEVPATYEKDADDGETPLEKEENEKIVKELPGDFAAVELPGHEVQRDPRAIIGQR